jgi:hypothetical protein
VKTTSEGTYPNAETPLRRARLPRSKTNRGAHPEYRGVEDLPDSGINGIKHAAARAKDILEIGLDDPARTDLRLISRFESELIGADR